MATKRKKRGLGSSSAYHMSEMERQQRSALRDYAAVSRAVAKGDSCSKVFGIMQDAVTAEGRFLTEYGHTVKGSSHGAPYASLEPGNYGESLSGKAHRAFKACLRAKPGASTSMAGLAGMRRRKSRR